jgi:hypothetical protein
MLPIFKLGFICMAFACGAAAAQVTEATITAEGSGMTRDEAVAAALASAAGQAFGVELNASSVSETMAAEAVTDTSSENVMLSAVNRSVVQVVKSPTNSPILGFTIDSAGQGIGNTWDAQVTLRYAKYQKLGGDTDRRGVVVMANDKRYRSLLTSTVSESLVASRRFDVLNRDHAALFEDEKDFVLGSDAGSAEVARLSLATGADYLLIAELQSLGIRNNMRETIRMTGEVLVKSAVSGTLKLQMIEFSTRKVKWSSSEKFGGTYEGVSSIGSGTLGKLIGNAADKLMDRLVTGIYPVRIVKVVGDTAVINRGEGSAAKGETYAVFLMGEDLVDPQSGESLGAMEVEVGLGQITDVKPKFSMLKMATGTLDPTGSYILRKTDKKPPSAVAPKGKKAQPPARKAQQPSRKDTFLN